MAPQRAIAISKGLAHHALSKKFLIVILSPILFSSYVLAEELATTSAPARSFTEFRPYVPEKTDYRFELGGMWEERSLYWMGANLGFHTGRCMFTNSQTCQQYIDALVGVGGREGQTNGLLMVGPRWQFVSFPRAVSPSLRFLVGMMDVRDNSRNQELLAAAIGYGWTVSVHERADLFVEIRAGTADKAFGQVFMGVNLKAEKWLDYFAERMKALGVGTAELTGNVIKSTLKTTGEMMGTVVGKPIQKAAQALSGKSDKKEEKEEEKKP